MNIITLKSFDNPIEANLLLARLENENIKGYLENEHTLTMDPLYSNAIGGIKIKILESDLTKSLEVIRSIDSSTILDENNEVIK